MNPIERTLKDGDCPACLHPTQIHRELYTMVYCESQRCACQIPLNTPLATEILKELKL